MASAVARLAQRYRIVVGELGGECPGLIGRVMSAVGVCPERLRDVAHLRQWRRALGPLD